MKLLVITQKVDIDDSVLGFFHRWITEFSKHFEKVTVICLEKGRSELPENVRVLSLGKEIKPSRFKYILNFYKYIWQERENYDVVFVHMNQEYVLLAGCLWKPLGKKVFLWRNHKEGNSLTRVAVFLSDKVFCTSRYSFTAQFKKTKIMPVGVDTSFFQKDGSIVQIKNSLLFFGRISPVKKVEIFIEACRLLKDRGVNFLADIIGDPYPSDQHYYNSIKTLAAKAGISQSVTFKPGIPNTQTPSLYSQYDIYINATPSGSLDKTILEALACETLVVTSNQSLQDFLEPQYIFKENDTAHLADSLSSILKWPEERKKSEGFSGRKKVEKNHSLELLMNKIKEEIAGVSIY